MKTSSLLIKLAKRFPKSIAEKYHDYVGKMVGELPQETNRILLCLDFDESLFEEAMSFKPDLIITHHPFIYGKRKEVLESDPLKAELVNALEAHHLCIYSMHTNFDAGRGGMNDSLAKALDLRDIYVPNDELMMRIGYLAKPMEIHEFAKYAKDCLNVKYGLLVHEGKSQISKVGIIGGGGSKDYKVALKEDCDIYISGDVPHYIRREVTRYKFNYLDLPHEIEKIYIKTMKDLLLDIDDSLEIKCIDHEELPEVI